MRKTLSIDIGYGYVKAATSPKETIKFPTVCARETRETLIDEGTHKYDMTIDGVKWRIGDFAIAKKGVRMWSSLREINSNSYIYLSCAANLLLNNGDEIDLCLGLPYGFYRDLNKGEQLIKDLTGKKIVTEYANSAKSFIIKTVHVYPQGAGNYFAKVSKLTDAGIPTFTGVTEDDLNAIMIDCGYRTLDCVTFYADDSDITLQEQYSFSNEDLGISTAMQKIANELTTRAGNRVEVDEVENLITQGKSTIYLGEDIQFKDAEEEAFKELAKSIYDDINQRIGATLLRYKNIYLCGGGANLLYDYLKEYIPRLKAEDTIYGNAIGYLIMNSKLNSNQESEQKPAKKEKATK